jgi:DNA-binding transcriptional regulator PaaX
VRPVSRKNQCFLIFESKTSRIHIHCLKSGLRAQKQRVEKIFALVNWDSNVHKAIEEYEKIIGKIK